VAADSHAAHDADCPARPSTVAQSVEILRIINSMPELLSQFGIVADWCYCHVGKAFSISPYWTAQ
jgi:hypothetical protein